MFYTMAFLDRITCRNDMLITQLQYCYLILRWPYLAGLLSFLGLLSMLVMQNYLCSFYAMFNGLNKRNDDEDDFYQ